MKITYGKPALPNVTVTFTPEEFILLGVVMGKIGGDIKNPIRRVFSNSGMSLHAAAVQYIADNKINVSMSHLCYDLVSESMFVADNQQQWSL